MAAGRLPAPGTEYGPCEPTRGKNGIMLTCGHSDCSMTRVQAASACVRCGKPIGYEVRFYSLSNEDGLAHAVCVEEETDHDYAQRLIREHRGSTVGEE